MMRIKLFIFFIAVLCLPVATKADSAGTTIYNFLAIDTNARAVGLGGAYSALAYNSSALAYNPAGLARNQQSEISFFHNQYFQGITQEYLSYASLKGWGASINYLSFGVLDVATISNPSGVGLSHVGLTDLAMSLGYGNKIGQDLSAGIVVKMVKESIAGVTGQGFMFDAGLLWDTPKVKGLTLAGVIQNIGPRVKFNTTNEYLPSVICIGGKYSIDVYNQNAIVALDVQKFKNESTVFKVGTEVSFGGVVPVRAGLTTKNTDGLGFSVGTGYSMNNLSFDYAYVPFKNLGNTHRFSITMAFNVKAANR